MSLNDAAQALQQRLFAAEKANAVLLSALQGITDELAKVSAGEPQFWMRERDIQMLAEFKKMASSGQQAIEEAACLRLAC